MKSNSVSQAFFIVIVDSQLPQSSSTVAFEYSRLNLPDCGAVSSQTPCGVPSANRAANTHGQSGAKCGGYMGGAHSPL